MTLTERKSKGKAVPLQAWSGPEGSRMLRFPDFMTTAQGADITRPVNYSEISNPKQPCNVHETGHCIQK